MIAFMTERVQTALKFVIHTYAESPIPHEWPNGNVSYEDEVTFRQGIQNQIIHNGITSHATRTKKEFLTEIEYLNQ